MKALVCEMCNSNDVVKQDGLYVCQCCGTKYTTEDAKKLMVDISGSSIKVDETDKAEKYRQLAQEARSMGNVEKAAQYYNELVTLCPEDWEAIFFSVYYTSASCIIAHISVAAANVGNAVKLVSGKINHLPADERKAICEQMVSYVLILKETLFKAAQNHQVKYGTTDSYNEFCSRKEAICQMVKDTADVALLCGLKSKAVELYESLAPTYDIWKVASLVESLEPGRGTKMVTPILEAKKAAQKKNQSSTIFSFIVLLLGIIGTALCLAFQVEGFLMYISVGLAAVFILLCPIFVATNAKAKKKIKQLEYDIAHLKD